MINAVVMSYSVLSSGEFTCEASLGAVCDAMSIANWQGAPSHIICLNVRQLLCECSFAVNLFAGVAGEEGR